MANHNEEKRLGAIVYDLVKGKKIIQKGTWRENGASVTITLDRTDTGSGLGDINLNDCKVIHTIIFTSTNEISDFILFISSIIYLQKMLSSVEPYWIGSVLYPIEISNTD